MPLPHIPIYHIFSKVFLVLENIKYLARMILNILYFLKQSLCPGMKLILDNVPCTLEKNGVTVVLGWKALCISSNALF